MGCAIRIVSLRLSIQSGRTLSQPKDVAVLGEGIYVPAFWSVVVLPSSPKSSNP
jgi:hypothetical protein